MKVIVHHRTKPEPIVMEDVNQIERKPTFIWVQMNDKSSRSFPWDVINEVHTENPDAE